MLPTGKDLVPVDLPELLLLAVASPEYLLLVLDLKA
jgi:hypothetical protein